MKRKVLRDLALTLTIIIFGIIGGSLVVKYFTSNVDIEKNTYASEEFLYVRDSILMQLNLSYASNDCEPKYMDLFNNLFSLSTLIRENKILIAISTNTCWTCVLEHIGIVHENFNDENVAFICPDVIFRSLHASLIAVGMEKTKIYYSQDDLFIQDLELPLYIFSSSFGTYLHFPIKGRSQLSGRAIQVFKGISGIADIK